MNRIRTVKFCSIIPRIWDIEQHKILELRGHKGSSWINENFPTRQNLIHWWNIDKHWITWMETLDSSRVNSVLYTTSTSVNVSEVHKTDLRLVMVWWQSLCQACWPGLPTLGCDKTRNMVNLLFSQSDLISCLVSPPHTHTLILLHFVSDLNRISRESWYNCE